MKMNIIMSILFFLVSACGSSPSETPAGFNEFLTRHENNSYIVNHTVADPQEATINSLEDAWVDVKAHWLSGPEFYEIDLWGVVNYWPTPDESEAKADDYPGYWGVGNCKAFAIYLYFYLSEEYSIESKLGLMIDPDIGGHVVVIVADTWIIDERGVREFNLGDDWQFIMRTNQFSGGWNVPVYI